MESLTDYYAFWAVYILAGLLGFWCWGKMAFWVKARGIGYHIYSAIGAIIIFTPVPVPDADTEVLSPGFIAAPFALISEGVAGLELFIPWFAVSAGIALSVTFVALLAGLAPKSDKQKEGGKPSAKPVRKTAPVKGNPFR
jgi:hypothetical protein